VHAWEIDDAITSKLGVTELCDDELDLPLADGASLDDKDGDGGGSGGEYSSLTRGPFVLVSKHLKTPKFISQHQKDAGLPPTTGVNPSKQGVKCICSGHKNSGCT